MIWYSQGVALLQHWLVTEYPVGSSLQKLVMRKKWGMAVVWSVSFFSFEMLGGVLSGKSFLLQLKINKSIPLEDLGVSTSELSQLSGGTIGYLWKVATRINGYKEVGTFSYRVAEMNFSISCTCVQKQCCKWKVIVFSWIMLMSPMGFVLSCPTHAALGHGHSKPCFCPRLLPMAEGQSLPFTALNAKILMDIFGCSYTEHQLFPHQSVLFWR